jgi:hypothetical protein
MRFVSFVSLVSFVSVVSLVSPRSLVHKKGGFSGDGSHSRIGLLIMHLGRKFFRDTQYWIIPVRMRTFKVGEVVEPH